MWIVIQTWLHVLFSLIRFDLYFVFDRQWRMVTVRLRQVPVATGGPQGQETDHCHSNTGQIQQLWLDETLQASLQWHRKQLEAVSAGQQHMGEFTGKTVIYSSGSKYCFWVTKSENNSCCCVVQNSHDPQRFIKKSETFPLYILASKSFLRFLLKLWDI